MNSLYLACEVGGGGGGNALIYSERGKLSLVGFTGLNTTEREKRKKKAEKLFPLGCSS